MTQRATLWYITFLASVAGSLSSCTQAPSSPYPNMTQQPHPQTTYLCTYNNPESHGGVWQERAAPLTLAKQKAYQSCRANSEEPGHCAFQGCQAQGQFKRPPNRFTCHAKNAQPDGGQWHATAMNQKMAGEEAVRTCRAHSQQPDYCFIKKCDAIW